VEFIASRPLARRAEAGRFYQRMGVLLAVLYALRGTDMHFENLVADGDHPVLVDLETLFHPALPTTSPVDPAASALRDSVGRTDLLPGVVAGQAGLFDQSGMGGDPGQPWPDPVLDWDPPGTDTAGLIWRTARFAGGINRPRWGQETIEPADYETDVVNGFRLGYDAIARGRPSFARLVEACGEAEVRVVTRPTRTYAWILDESTQPELLRDARTRWQAVEGALTASAGYPSTEAIEQHELADLWTGDIPLITARPGARHLWTSAGQVLPGVLDQTPLSCALETIGAMGKARRQEQEWVISASMATRRTAGGHLSSQPAPGPAAPTSAEPSRLLAAACGLADQIMACGRTERDGAGQWRVNWPGLQLVDEVRWMLLPMGASLADGYLGVALFLAQLAAHTGTGRYAEEAKRALRPVPVLLGMLAGRSDLLAAIGCGGIRGFGGISYGLARIGSLLDDAEIRYWAQASVQVTATAASLRKVPGWAAGTAGCLAAMMAVRTEIGSAAAAAVARACADELLELVEQTDGECASDGDRAPPGFAAGPAGIGWALTRFAAFERASARASRCLRAGRHAVLSDSNSAGLADSPTGYGWCSGAAGVLLARTCLADDAGATGLDRAVRALADRPLLSDLSLCHGELGIAEALTVMAASGQSATAHQALRHRAGLICGAVERRAWHCGTPGGVVTPGLVNGLAGIGYGLLRLAFPTRVPSLLLLEPTPGQAHV
jgi:type 2 lantibiotic biosynthesis protein LanM